MHDCDRLGSEIQSEAFCKDRNARTETEWMQRESTADRQRADRIMTEKETAHRDRGSSRQDGEIQEGGQRQGQMHTGRQASRGAKLHQLAGSGG